MRNVSAPLLFLGSWAASLLPAAPTVRDLDASPELSITAPVTGAAPAWKMQTAVAFGGAHHLVAWTDYRDAAGDGPVVYAARVAPDGVAAQA